MAVISGNSSLFSFGRASSLVLPAAWHPRRARVYTTAQMRAPAEFRGACSGSLKSRILANNYGESLRPATVEPSKTMETPQF